MGLRPPLAGQRWALAAALAASSALALVSLDVLRWHPGFAMGDESDVLSFLQRYNEGMPWRWMILNGSLHKSLLAACMRLWPGNLWVSSLPNLAALAGEAVLLFMVGRSLAGPRAAFFAVLLGLVSAFTLLRARVALSYGLFPVEWLGLVWLRGKVGRPRSALLWGALLGLCLFDYEGWLASAALLLLLPLGSTVDRRQRAWELAGCAVLLLALLSWGPWVEYLVRRRSASLGYAAFGAPGARALAEILLGGSPLPYLAPSGTGVCAPWLLLLALLGFGTWGRRGWPWLAVLALGLALPLMGGAPYGLPAHRFIVAWPAVALGAGMGADRLLTLWPTKSGAWALGLLLAAGLGQQTLAWRRSQDAMDGRYRAPMRDMKRAADAARAETGGGRALVTELHPVKGALFRFLVGRPVPLPDAAAKQVLALVPSDYAPALRGNKGRGEVRQTFQEQAGGSASLVLVLDGADAAEVLRTEREIRPLLASRQQGTPENAQAAKAWLAGNPQAGPWARTIALDSASMAAWYNLRFSFEDYAALMHERLVSARPLLLVAPTVAERDPVAALQLLRRAEGIDPANARVRQLEVGVLRRLGKDVEARRLETESAALDQRGRLVWE